MVLVLERQASTHGLLGETAAQLEPDCKVMTVVFRFAYTFLCKIEQFEITLLKGYNPDKQVGSFYITTARFPIDEVSNASRVIR